MLVALSLAVSNEPIQPLEPRLRFVAATMVLVVVGAALLGFGRWNLYRERNAVVAARGTLD